MKKLIILFSLIFSFLFNTSLSAQNNTINENVRQYLKKQNSTLTFIENKGQFKDSEGNTRNDILYLAKANGMKIYFFQNKISYVFGIKDEEKDVDEHSNGLQRTKLYRYDVELIGSNAKVQSFNELPGTTNYMGSGNPITDVKSYQKLTYSDLYENIDLVFYNSEKGLKYDFIVKPGGDPKKIKMKYTGIENIELVDGQTIDISLPFGKIKETLPITYEKFKNPNNGKNTKKVNCTFAINDNTITFDVGDYDEENWLVIDPVVHWYSYMEDASDDDITGLNYNQSFQTNGSGYDYAGGGMYVDPDSDDIYITGSTESDCFPAGTYFSSSTWNIFLLKINSTGTYSDATRVLKVINDNVGEEDDFGIDVVCDDTYVYILGTTYSDDFYTSGWTNGSLQPVCNSCPTYSDMIILKFTKSNFNTAPTATYYGGSNYDIGHRIELFEDNEIPYNESELVILGETTSDDINNVIPPLTACSSCPNNPDVIIACMNRDLTAVDWERYYGGNSTDNGLGLDIDDPYNIIYATGATKSTNLPTSALAIHPNLSGNTDAFVLTINGNTGALIYSSYFGSTGEDFAQDIDYLGNNRYVIAGYTKSSGFFQVSPPYPQLYSTLNGKGDGFFTQFENTAGTHTVSSSFYVGGGEDDRINDIEYDGSNVYISGYTKSNNFPIYKSQHILLNGDDSEEKFDAFVGVFDLSVNNLVSLSYFGGSSDDYGIGVGYFSNTDRFVLSGNTASSFTTPCDEPTDRVTTSAGSNVFVTNFGDGNGWPTYIGGSSDDICNDVFIDGSDYVYFTGESSSSDFPTTPGVYQDTIITASDIIISKFTPDGIPVFMTYYGGTGKKDVGTAIKTTNRLSDIFVAGYTNSSGLEEGGYSQTYSGNYDAFLLGLSPNGQDLEFFTYIGGSGSDKAEGLEWYGETAYICGNTESNTIASFSGTYNDNVDAFVASFNDDGLMNWGKYFGGSGDDYAMDLIAIVDNGTDFGLGITGYTNSSDFSATTTTYNEETYIDINNGFDGFFIINPFDGSSCSYGTYIGGKDGDDVLYAIDYHNHPTSDGDEIYMAGYTESTTSSFTPVPSGLNNSTDRKGLVCGLSYLSSPDVWSLNKAYIEYSEENKPTICYDIKVNNSGEPCVAGVTDVVDILHILIESGSLQDSPSANVDDGFFKTYNQGLTDRASTSKETYIGGSSDDELKAIDFFSNGDVIFAANTESANLASTYSPTGVYTFDDTYASDSDIFLARITTSMSVAKPVVLENVVAGASEMNLLVYPNPAENELYFELLSNEDGVIEIEISSISGALVKKFNMNLSSGQNINTININFLQSGVYFIKFKQNEQISIAKFIKL